MHVPYDKPLTEISIHILHAEDDGEIMSIPGASQKFQSTSSMRRMTFSSLKQIEYKNISIHILHAEDDTARLSHSATKSHFNPHPPCGG